MVVKYDKMLELLKIPQLMEKRVKGADYEAALQLYQFINQLAKKHDKNQIILSIVFFIFFSVGISIHFLVFFCFYFFRKNQAKRS